MRPLRLAVISSLLAFAGSVSAQPVQPPPDAGEVATEAAGEEVGIAAPAEVPPQTASPLPPTGSRVRVVLKDGQVLRGTLKDVHAHILYLATGSGSALTLPRDAVATVEPEQDAVHTTTGEVWFRDPNRTRYFYGPSAMMLRKGQSFFSQKELFFSSFGYGITDNVSVLAGTVAPAWLLGPEGFNALLGVKAGMPVVGHLHAAVGLEALLLPGFGLGGFSPVFAGLPFASVTYGPPDLHMTLSVGKPAIFQSGHDTFSMDLVTTVSGSARVHENFALMSENWLVLVDLADRDFGSMHAVGGRWMMERISVDLGFIWVLTSNGRGVDLLTAFPIPWVDFTWNFSLGGG